MSETTQQPKKFGRPKGAKHSRTYRFMVLDTDTNEKYHFFSTGEIADEIGIPPPTVFYMLRSETHSCKVWNNYEVHRCRIPAKKLKKENVVE